MKKCPQCGREYDLSMRFCLDDGAELLYGPASGSVPPAVAAGLTPSSDFNNEPKTAILSAPSDDRFESPTAILQPPATAGGSDSSERQSMSANRAATPLVIIAVVVVLLIGGFFGYRYFKSAGGEQISSIAVLAFENRSGSTDTDYLSDGLADSLIYRLSQLPNLKVSPTSSVMRYKGKETDVAQIAKELEVDAVMSGRLVQRGDDLSISVQLIDSRTKKLIWAEQ